jgi:glutaredoxin
MKATVYTGIACTWCERVKTLLKDNGYEVEEIVVNKDILKELEIKSGEIIRTVPQVVIDNELIGGYHETEELMVGTASINKV